MLYSGNFDEPQIGKRLFLKLGHLALNNVIMSTHNGYYVQELGLAMGSPLSPLLANLWLTKFDNKFREMNPKLYFRYVDDICMTIRKEDIEKTIDVVNNWHTNLKFTYEAQNLLDISTFLT